MESFKNHQRFFLKGQCHETFDPRFLHDSNPSGPIIQIVSISLNYLQNAYAQNFEVSLTPWSQAKQFQSSVVSMTQQSQTPWYH